MSKVMVVNDIHVSDRPPASCTEAYAEDLLELLNQTVDVADQYRVAAIVWSGDVFNSKAPNRNSHRLMQRVLSIGKSYAAPWYIVPGNHDMQHDQLSSIWDTQPLGVLFRAAARPLIGRCKEFPYLYGVPWQQDWSDEAVGEALRDFREDDFAAHGSSHLVVAHAPLYPPGHELPYENYDAVMWASAMGNRGYCAYGHVHEYHGAWLAAGVSFCNNGALSRGSLHEYNLKRSVGVTIWDSQTGVFDFVQLKARPAEEVFRLREKQEVTDTAGKLDDFLQSVGGAHFQVLSAEVVLEHVRASGAEKDVVDEIAELLEWAAHQE